MKTWLLTWNPKYWPWNDRHNGWLELKHQIDQVGKAYATWSCGNNKSISVGDRIFLMRLGEEPKGIVASGFAASAVFEGPHWDPERFANGDTCRRIYVEYETILNPAEESILPYEFLKTRLPDYRWCPQRPGIEIPPDTAVELESVWRSFLGR